MVSGWLPRRAKSSRSRTMRSARSPDCTPRRTMLGLRCDPELRSPRSSKCHGQDAAHVDQWPAQVVRQPRGKGIQLLVDGQQLLDLLRHLGFQPPVVHPQALHFERALHRRHDAADAKGLLHIVDGAVLHRVDHAADAAVRGHEHDDHVGRHSLRTAGEFDAVDARHLQVGEQQLKAGFVELCPAPPADRCIPPRRSLDPSRISHRARCWGASSSTTSSRGRSRWSVLAGAAVWHVEGLPVGRSLT